MTDRPTGRRTYLGLGNLNFQYLIIISGLRKAPCWRTFLGRACTPSCPRWPATTPDSSRASTASSPRTSSSPRTARARPSTSCWRLPTPPTPPKQRLRDCQPLLSSGLTRLTGGLDRRRAAATPSLIPTPRTHS